MPWVIFTAEFLVLFATSRFLFKSLFALLYFVFRSQKAAVFLLSLFFLPGVVVHELSHLITAELLRVRTHGIEFVPELTGTSLKMGSVKVEKSDNVRSLLIGVAPVVVGVGILCLSLFLVGKGYLYQRIFSSWMDFVFVIVGGYVIFVITNTMFSSKKDVEGLFELLLVAGVVVGGLYFVGVRVHEFIVPYLMQPKILSVIQNINWLMGIPVALNVGVVILSLPIVRKLHLV